MTKGMFLMTTEITAFNLDPNDSSTCDFQIQLPRKCPICSTAHASSPVCSGYLHRRYGNAKLYSMFFCPSCESAFFVSYRVTDDYSNYSKTCGTIIAQYPNPSTTTPFSEEISILSPKFVEIYHQSEIAESTNLTEICGIGFARYSTPSTRILYHKNPAPYRCYFCTHFCATSHI